MVSNKFKKVLKKQASCRNIKWTKTAREDGMISLNTKEQIQTDGQRHRSTEESGTRFAIRFIGHSLRRLVENRPACK